MNHYVYKITNNVNCKIYVGMRSSEKLPNEDTGYWGSSKVLRKAFSKYGKENFTKEIVACLNSREEAFELEELIVDSEFVKRRDTYNKCMGGRGVGHEDGHPRYGATLTDDHKEKMRKGSRDKFKDEDFRNAHSERLKKQWEDPEFVQAVKDSKKGWVGEGHPRWGMTHSEESKRKMSESAKKRNEKFGKRVLSEETKKKIAKSNRNYEKVTCPHCSKEGKKASMVRWHFDNCKHKKG